MSQQSPEPNPPLAATNDSSNDSVLEKESTNARSTPAAEMAKIHQIEQQLAHIWMVRNFLKHCDEAEDDEDLKKVQRQLYDYIHAVGIHIEQKNFAEAIRFAKKKLTRLKNATLLFIEIQEEVSTHTNFRMANRSLQAAADTLATIIKTH